MLQAFVVVPVFALAYLIAGPPKLGRRLFQLALAGIALIVSSLWWVVAVMAIPAADRPLIGGSQRRPDLLALARRRDPAGGRIDHDLENDPHGPYPCFARHLGWLVGLYRAGLLPRPRHHLPVLHVVALAGPAAYIIQTASVRRLLQFTRA
jgi:hypothetical protein